MTADRIPDVVLERFRLGELLPRDATRIVEALDRDAELRERLERLDRSDRDLGPEVDRLRARLDGLAPRAAAPIRAALFWAGPAVALAAVLVIAVIARTYAPAAPPDDVDRIKGSGGAGLVVYRRTADGSERLADNAVARKGDLIRIAYRAAGRSHGVIVSVDGLGNVTTHLPPTGARAAALKADATVLLDQAYELDDAPRWEQFYFVAGDRAFDVGPIVQAAHAVAEQSAGSPPSRLALPPGFEQASFTLQKASR
jgi:hypothetical protein